MRLYRLKLRPLSAWMTPWQADTLFGMLCGMAACYWGAERLQKEILEPALQGRPPFVLSDAFPGDLLPVPLALRTQDWGEAERKAIKRARWLRSEAFRAVQEGRQIAAGELLPDKAFQTVDRLHNQLSRVTDTTGEGGLFACAETFLNTGFAGLAQTPYLSVYVRVADTYRASLLELFRYLSYRGFGADTTTGKGAFAPPTALEPMAWLEDAFAGANGVLVLSSYQPAPGDPTEGFWEVFIKYGKVGPEFGLANVFKRPLVLLRPGACFYSSPERLFVGRALPMEAFLPAAECQALRQRGITTIHTMFGLAVPMRL